MIALTPLAKLAEVGRDILGKFYDPTAIRKKSIAEGDAKREVAKAEGDAKRELATAEVDAMNIFVDGKLAIMERVKARLVGQEVGRQENLESIFEQSIKYLPPAVSPDPVGDEWRSKFVSGAQDVTGKEMQDAWAKVLAAEVARPGSFGFRTLDMLSRLSKEEAEIFQRLCAITIFSSTDYYVLHYDPVNPYDKYGIPYRDLLVLQDAGLVQYGYSTMGATATELGLTLFMSLHAFLVTCPPHTQLNFKCHILTRAGRELWSLAVDGAAVNEAFMSDLRVHLEQGGHAVTLTPIIRVDSNPADDTGKGLETDKVS